MSDPGAVAAAAVFSGDVVSSAAVRRLQQVTALPSGSDGQRGVKVTAMARALMNVSADLVADHVRDMLATRAWREYTLPNGTGYAWGPAEFDYFLAACGIDPGEVTRAVRASGDRALMLALADASDRRHPTRRTPADVAAAYPQLSGRVTEARLGGASLHRLLPDGHARRRFLDGEGADAARRTARPRSWRVRWTGDPGTTAAADAIVASLRSRPDLAAAVRARLDETLPSTSVEPASTRDDSSRT